jgi:hypothetical protein
MSDGSCLPSGPNSVVVLLAAGPMSDDYFKKYYFEKIY